MRSAKLMNGRVFAGARALYRAAGVDGKDFGKPIIAIANSFDEFLPGHVHLNKVGRLISDAIKEAGGIPREFNTMAVDDGIAMGRRSDGGRHPRAARRHREEEHRSDRRDVRLRR